MALTLYRICSPSQADSDVEADATVEVTATQPPPPEGEDVLYELHPLPSLAEETDTDGVYRIRWKDALNWPHQITAP